MDDDQGSWHDYTVSTRVGKKNVLKLLDYSHLFIGWKYKIRRNVKLRLSFLKVYLDVRSS